MHGAGGHARGARGPRGGGRGDGRGDVGVRRRVAPEGLTSPAWRLVLLGAAGGAVLAVALALGSNQGFRPWRGTDVFGVLWLGLAGALVTGGWSLALAPAWRALGVGPDLRWLGGGAAACGLGLPVLGGLLRVVDRGRGLEADDFLFVAIPGAYAGVALGALAQLAVAARRAPAEAPPPRALSLRGPSRPPAGGPPLGFVRAEWAVAAAYASLLSALGILILLGGFGDDALYRVLERVLPIAPGWLQARLMLVGTLFLGSFLGVAALLARRPPRARVSPIHRVGLAASGYGFGLLALPVLLALFD